MDPKVKFDPNYFDASALNRLKRLLIGKSFPPDEDGCRVFADKARCGNYPTCKIGPEFSAPFGKARGNYNPSAVLKSIETGQVIIKYEFATVHLSHLCGNPLCLTTSHLIFESMDNNNKRQDCHSGKKCVGEKRHKLPACIIRTHPITIV